MITGMARPAAATTITTMTQPTPSPSAGALAAGAAGGPPLEAVSAVLHFTVPNQTVSGLAVRDLQLVNERYKFVKGVKTVLRTGRFQLRI